MLNRLLFAALLSIVACGNGGDGKPEPEPVYFDSDVEWLGDSHTALMWFSGTVSEFFDPNRVRHYAIPRTTMRAWSPLFGPTALYFTERVGETTTENCFILLGSNDSTRFGSSPELYRDSMEELVYRWIEDGCHRAWVMSAPKLGEIFDDVRHQRMHDFHREWREFCSSLVAREAGVRCGPDLYKMIDPAIHLSDFVHMNAEGNRIVSDEIIRLLKIKRGTERQNAMTTGRSTR